MPLSRWEASGGSDIKTVTVGTEIVARALARRRVATAVPACGSVCAETY